MSEIKDFDPSRRLLLKGAGVLAAGVAIGATVGKLIESEPTSAERRDNFNRLGVADWYPFYQEASSFLAMYRTTPQYTFPTYDGIAGQNPLSTARIIARNRNPDAAAIELLRDGWGTKIDFRSEAAVDKAQKIGVSADSGLSDTESSIREYIALVGKLLPYHILTAPDHFHVQSAGGHYAGTAQASTGNPAEIAFTSLANDPEKAAVSLAHELGHVDQSMWRRGREFVDKERYIDYLCVKTRCVRQLIEAYFSLDWSEARTFKIGSPLVLVPNNISIEHIAQNEGRLAKKYQMMDFIMSSELTREERYNRLIHAVGRKYRTLRTQEQQGLKPLTNLDDSFIYHDSYDWYKFAIEELDHYFCGPVQVLSDKRGMPRSLEEVGMKDDDLLTRANIEIQKARLRAFSTLPDEVISDPDRMFSSLRQGMGLD